MQHRYTGDIGDYLKLALLRALPEQTRLGVAWWLHPDESHNDDGRHVQYLNQPDKWRAMAPELFDALSNIVSAGARSVSSLQASGLIPTIDFHSDQVPTGRSRFAQRDKWFATVSGRIKAADVIFVDPDNGIDIHVDADARCSAKHITLREISSLAGQGRSLIIYHHQTRAKGGHALEISRITGQLRALRIGSVSAIRARPYSPRVFFVIGDDDQVHASLQEFALAWPDVFEVFDDRKSEAIVLKAVCSDSSWQAHILTLYPDMFPGPLGHSMAGRALAEGIWSCAATNIRDFATDKHRTVDDTPAGGGAGMVLRADVLARAVDAVAGQSILPACGEVAGRSPDGGGVRPSASVEAANPLHHPAGGPPPRCGEDLPILAMTPRGTPITQARIRDLAQGPGVIILCGRFEGFDERLFEARPDIEQVSMGDIILSGGEVGALMLLDACIRLLPGVMGAASSGDDESFEGGLLEYPHYTRPAMWEGRTIPEVLRSGDHAKIAAWRKHQAEDHTRLRRPDLWERHADARDRPASGARQQKKDLGHEPHPDD